MKKLFLVLFLIFMGSPTEVFSKSELETEAYKSYLSKLIPSLKADNIILEIASDQTPDSKWLQDLEKSLYENVQSRFDADFVFTLTKEGYIRTLDILEIRENDFQVFKKFLAEFLAFCPEAPPVGLSPTHRFHLNAKWLYIDTYNSIENTLESSRFTKLISKNPREDLEKRISRYKILQVKLLKPSYIDFPAIGEEIEFLFTEDQSESLIKTQVEAYNSKKLFLRSKDLHFELDRPETKYLSYFGDAALTGATKGGVFLATQTYGISTASFTALALGGAYLLDKETETPLGINSGDMVTLRQRRERS
jgi:hypothetical protein